MTTQQLEKANYLNNRISDNEYKAMTLKNALEYFIEMDDEENEFQDVIETLQKELDKRNKWVKEDKEEFAKL